MSELKTSKDMHVMITEFPDGIVIGWDHCTISNGGCGKRVSQCKCKDGPHYPKVFDRWLVGEGNMPQYNNPDRHKKTATPKVSDAMQTAVAAAADVVEGAQDDLGTLRKRIDVLQAQSDEELATNGKTKLFMDLKDKLHDLFAQADKMMEDTPA